MKRILIFSTAYLPLIGGAEMAIKDITDRLPDFEFDLLCARINRNLPKQEKIGRVDVYRLGFGFNLDKFLLPLTGFLKARFLIERQPNNYRAIWAVMASYGGLAALFFKRRYPQVPFLLTLQEGDSWEHIKKRARFIYSFFKQIFERADYIQAISNFLADWARAMGATCPTEVVPNGVDLEKFRMPESFFHDEKLAREDLKKRLNIGPAEKLIVTASRLVAKNGVGDLIAAMHFLKEAPYRLSNIKLLILGDGALRKDLEQQVKDYKLEQCVLFVGQISHRHLPQYLALADVFVRPSLSEGLGTAFLEAMSCGAPIIGTPVGGIPDFLIDGETGLFCQPRNPQSIAEKINLLLTDDGLRKKISAQAKKLIDEKYSWNLVARNMREIFQKI